MMRAATLWAASGAGVALSSAAAVALWLGPREVFGSQVAQSQFTAWFAISLAIAVVVLAPAAGVVAGLRARRGHRVGWLASSTGLAAVRPVIAAIVMFAAGVAGGTYALQLATVREAAPAVLQLAVLCTTVVFLGCWGALASTVLFRPLDALAAAVTVSVASASAWLVLGPVLERLPAMTTMAALVMSPVVTLASLGSVDIFHIEPIYELSPLAHGQAAYPAASTVGAAYVTAAVALGVAAAWRLGRLAEFFRRKDIA